MLKNDEVMLVNIKENTLDIINISNYTIKHVLLENINLNDHFLMMETFFETNLFAIVLRREMLFQINYYRYEDFEEGFTPIFSH